MAMVFTSSTVFRGAGDFSAVKSHCGNGLRNDKIGCGFGRQAGRDLVFANVGDQIPRCGDRFTPRLKRLLLNRFFLQEMSSQHHHNVRGQNDPLRFDRIRLSALLSRWF